MSEILAICREHGQALCWWDELDSETQGLYLADHRKRMRRKPKRRRNRGRP